MKNGEKERLAPSEAACSQCRRLPYRANPVAQWFGNRWCKRCLYQVRTQLPEGYIVVNTAPPHFPGGPIRVQSTPITDEVDQALRAGRYRIPEAGDNLLYRLRNPPFKERLADAIADVNNSIVEIDEHGVIVSVMENAPDVGRAYLDLIRDPDRTQLSDRALAVIEHYEQIAKMLANLDPSKINPVKGWPHPPVTDA